MRIAPVLLTLIILGMQGSPAFGGVIRIRTGQVAGVPGSCSGQDDRFHFYSPQPLCSHPILSSAFQPADFDSACAGPPAIVVLKEQYTWVAGLACDPDARWIASGLADIVRCYGARRSVLYCAPFENRFPCTTADSIRVCWAVDDYLGDPPAFPGPNPGGVYLNGIDLGPAFRGLGASQERSAVAYNVPLNAGLNQLAVYQRDAGCGVAGLILSASVYTCETVPAAARTWTTVKSLYRDPTP